jgi:hypothetical protein
MIAKFSEFGMKATHCLKDADVTTELDISNITFLKRSWALLGSRIVWRRSLEDIFDGLNYAHKFIANKPSELMKTITNLLGDISLHGEHEYEKFRALLLSAFDSLGWKYDLPEYADYLRHGPAGDA